MTPSTTRSATRRRTLGLVAAGGAALLLAGCSATNPVTTARSYDASDGTSLTSGSVRAHNLIVLTSAEGEPGVLIGALSNDGREETRATIVLPDGSDLSLDLDGGQTLVFGGSGEAVSIDEVPTAPGGITTLTLTTDMGEETGSVPVLDGTLPEYTEYVPEA